jgi:hypothetical protein
MAAFLFAAGCGDATGLVVFVDSDLEPVTELFAVEASASVEVGAAVRRFEIAEAGLPFSFGIEAPPGRHAADVSIHLLGLDPSQLSVVRLTMMTRFVPGRTLILPAPLARACQSEPCEGTELTCRGGECVERFVDPSTLSSRAPDRLFDGPSLPDAGTDAAVCVDGEECDSGNPCRPGMRRCEPETCEPGPAMAEGSDCGDGRVCDAAGRCGR